MSFRETSAWAMGLLTLVVGFWYLGTLLSLSGGQGLGARIGPIIPYVMAMTVGSIMIQTTLAIRSPKEAGTNPDERERPLIDRAGNWSGVALCLVVVAGALEFIIKGDGDRLFTWVMGGLILSQIVEYGAQIALFRRDY